MKRLLALLLFAVSAYAQSTPSIAGLYSYDGTNWNPLPGTGTGPVVTGPSIVGIACWNAGLSQWVTTGCGTGGSTAWSSLTNPTGNLSLTMGANNSIFGNANNFSTGGTSFVSPWQFSGNGLNFATEWFNLYNNNTSYPSDEMDVGISVPATTTAFQSDAISGIAKCAEPSGNFYCLGIYAQASRAATGSFTHAFNANVNDNNFGGGGSPYNLFAGEFNSQVHNVGSSGATVMLSANIYNANTSYDALDVGNQLGNGPNPYKYGINLVNGIATTGISVGTAATGTSSMPVNMVSTGGTGSYSYDASGNFQFTGPVVAPNTPLSPGNSVTDNFIRAAGSLGANWTGGSTIQIISNGVVGSTSGSGNDFAWYTGAGTFATTQCSSISIQALPTTNTWIGVTVNNQSSGNNYLLQVFSTTSFQSQWELQDLGGAGVIIALRNWASVTPMAVGDNFKLCNNGGVLTAYRNGVAEATTATSSHYTGGYPGFAMIESSPARISSFTGTGLTSNFVNIGGTFAAAGCTDFTAATVANATTSMACVLTGQGGNPANVVASCAVTAANTVTPRLCSFTAQTVTAQNYTMRVIP